MYIIKKEKAIKKCNISIFGEIKIKESKIWVSHFQIDLKKNPKLFSEFFSFH